jgi:hypothetical protein
VTDLHAAISQDPNGKQLEETIRRYNQWLADLSSSQREAILSIKDPQKRIDRIRELMIQQEKERFNQFVEEDVSKPDRDTIYTWVEEFVIQHEKEILDRLPHEARKRLTDTPDETARRKALIANWHFARRRDSDMLAPKKADFDKLFEKLSHEARMRVTAVAKAEQRDQRLNEFMRAAIISRIYPPPGREELQRFYAGMKSDDPRRERLEGLERDELYRELRRMFGQERFGGRGIGPGGGQRGGPGRGGPGGGRSDGPPPPEFRGERPPLPKGEGKGPEIQP